MTEMQYRVLPRGGEKISVIGLGMGSIHEGSEEEIEKTLKLALERGVNYFDMAASEAKPIPVMPARLKGSGNRSIFRCISAPYMNGGKYRWDKRSGENKKNV